MSSVTWTPGLSLSMPEGAIRDYTFGFAAWLEGDTIVSAEAEGVGLTVGAPVVTSPTVKVRVSEAGANSKLTLAITTAAGQVEPFDIYFNPVETTCASCC